LSSTGGRDFATAAEMRKQTEVYVSIIGLAGKTSTFKTGRQFINYR
jgi:hypothetical protein